MSQPFTPLPGSTVLIDVSSSTQAKALTTVNPGTSIRVCNDGTATAWIDFGNSTVTTAATTGIPIGAGVVEIYAVPSGATHVAAIAASTTGKIYFTTGNGI